MEKNYAPFLKPFLYFSILLALLLTLNCAVPPRKPCLKDGRDCSKIYYKIEVDDWDSCYLRGSSYMDCKCYDLAIAEFKKAIRERQNDERRARTYGMHFMGYYPHRELGIIYYKLGQIEAAIKELERSVEDSPSSKAKYFLNAARRIWIQGSELDHIPPKLHITFPPLPYYVTNARKLTIEGQAEDDRFITDLAINNEPMFIELSAKTIPFNKTITMKKGKNLVTITTSDFMERTTQKTLEIFVDRTGPIINFVHSPLESAYLEKKMLIRGIVLDDTNIEMLSINDRPLEIKKGEFTEFNHMVPLTKDMDSIVILARDIAGNETKGQIDLSPLLKTDKDFVTSKEYDPDMKSVSILKKQNNIKIASLNNFMPLLAGNTQETNEENPIPNLRRTLESFHSPQIKTDPLPQKILFEEVLLQGEIQYQTDLSYVHIYVNDKLIPMEIKDKDLISSVMEIFKQTIGIKEKKSLMLSEIIELDLGDNEIRIELADKKGVTKNHTVPTIHRKKEKILDEKYRLVITILPVKDLSEIKWFLPSEETKEYLFVKLNESFIEQKRFQIVNRQKLSNILLEHRISISELSDIQQALQVGKLLKAEAIFTSYLREQEEDAIELIGDMVDTETSRYICSDDIYVPGNSDDNLSEAAEKLAMKIRQHFPLCKGKVLEKKKAKIKINLGHQDDLCEHAKLLVYREAEWESLILSEARVEKVFNDYSRALLLNKEKEKGIIAEDLVITK